MSPGDHKPLGGLKLWTYLWVTCVLSCQVNKHIKMKPHPECGTNGIFLLQCMDPHWKSLPSIKIPPHLVHASSRGLLKMEMDLPFIVIYRYLPFHGQFHFLSRPCLLMWTLSVENAGGFAYVWMPYDMLWSHFLQLSHPLKKCGGFPCNSPAIYRKWSLHTKTLTSLPINKCSHSKRGPPTNPSSLMAWGTPFPIHVDPFHSEICFTLEFCCSSLIQKCGVEPLSAHGRPVQRILLPSAPVDLIDASPSKNVQPLSYSWFPWPLPHLSLTFSTWL